MITLTDCWYEYPANREEDAGPAPEAQPAVRGISFSVNEGEFLCIVGHNGSGKSTVAKLMNALYLPSGGSVSVLGMDTKDEMLTQDIRRTVGLVLQNPDNQIVTTIVEEDVAFGLENLGVPPPQIRERVDEALFAVGLSKFARSAPHMLSGGQKQRVAIAGVLAMQTRVMVMDEPTAMLDPSGRREVLRTMLKLRREKGMTLVLITHFMEEAMLADRVIVMEDGAISMQGAPREILSRVDALKKAGLEPPSALLLANRLRGRGVALTEGVMSGGELVREVAALRGAARTPRFQAARLPKLKKRRDAGPAGRTWIETRDLTHIYMQGSPTQSVAIEGVTLSVGGDEFIGVIGHTGSGKSTLVQHMNGLLRPNGGSIVVDGVQVPQKGGDMRAIRRTVGMVFQYPEYQLFEETVEKDIAFGPKNLGLSGDELDARVKEAMRDVGLRYELYAPRSPFELSGGEKRRAAIAGVLAMQPRVLVLDEPTAGLDPRGREEILSMVRRWRANGRTVVMISHGMDDIARYCTRVIVMAGGRMILQGTPEEVFARAKELREIGLDLPAAASIARKLRKKGVYVPRGVVTMAKLESAIALGMGVRAHGAY